MPGLLIDKVEEHPELQVLAKQVSNDFRILLVVFLPEFHWPDIRSDKNDAPKKWAPVE